MTNVWIFYWWIFMLPAVAVWQVQVRRRRQMGPRVQVEPHEFVRIVEHAKGLVIKGRGTFLQGTTYVTRMGDYYYYTITKEALALPTACEIREAKNVLL